MIPDALAHSLQEFLSRARSAVVMEDDQVLFDLSTAQYSISAEKGRCLLHLWSEERNLVRQVIDVESKNGSLSLTVRRFAQARPSKLEICCDRDRRVPSAQRAVQSRYARMLERLLRRQIPDWQLDGARLSTTMDLERSFSPVYARGLLRKGRSALVVFGVNQEETQAAIDASLTFALLWLESCREREAGRCLVEGLRLYVPAGSSTTLQSRMAHLDYHGAKFHLFELNEHDESVLPVDYSDQGNIDTRLVRCPDSSQARSRFAQAVNKVLGMAPRAEMAVLSPSEIAFKIHGLEFARVRAINVPGTFRLQGEVIFGPPGYETRLTDEAAAGFAAFISQVMGARCTHGDRNDPLWRMYPERWLESLIFKNVSGVDSRLDPAHVYSQVPAFSA